MTTSPVDRARELLDDPALALLLNEAYRDTDGNVVTLDKLCRTEPAWAANRIRHERQLLADLLAEVGRLERERDGLREVLGTLHTWADGFENPRTGMGAGLHAEMYPTLSPSARRYLLQMTRDALTKGPTDGRDG